MCASLLTILTWCVQFEPFSPWRYSLQLSVWRGRDQFSYKPSSFIFQPLRRGLIQFTISFGSHFAFYLKHGTEFENELKIIEKYLEISFSNSHQITNTILIFHYFSKNEKIICIANKWEVTKRKWVIFAKASAYFLVQQIQPPPSLARIALNHSLFSELCFAAIASPQREIGNQLFKLMWKH